MKVKPEDGYRMFWTLEEADAAKVVIRSEKDDEEKPEGWAAYAVREALKGTDESLLEVIHAEAEVTKNLGIERDSYGEGSGYMDVRIKALARITQPGLNHAYMEIVAMLSDIWQTGAVDYRSEMVWAIYTAK